MERLTERLNNLKKGVSQMGDKEVIKVNKFFLKNVCEYLEQLKSYKDAEEQGLLLKLPCKVGTELFLSDYLNAHHRLKKYKFLGSDVAVVIECWEFQRTCTRMLSDFGKTIFLTKEEAEQALKQIGE